MSDIVALEKLAATYDKELQIARNVQQGLLSVENPHIEGIRLAMSCVPAESIGGDFYTFVNKIDRAPSTRAKSPGVIEYQDRREQHLGIAIGDVAGHGIGSALVMALASGIIREAGLSHRSPADSMAAANTAIARFISNSQIPYVTAFYGVLKIDSKILTYAKAGHLPSILVRADGSLSLLDAAGVFLGMYPNEHYEDCQVQLASGDRVYFYTDGITEAQNEAGDFFEFDRFKTLLLENHTIPIETLKQKILDTVAEFTGMAPVKDDQTIVILEIV